MEAPRVLVFLLLLFLFFASPTTRPPSLTQQLELDHVIEKETYAVGWLNGSHYGDFNVSAPRWANLTGLRRSDNYSWELLAEVRSRAREQRRRLFSNSAFPLRSSPDNEHDLSSGHSINDTGAGTSLVDQSKEGDQVYQNVTGFVQGKWVRSGITTRLHPNLNLTSLAPTTLYTTEGFQYNVTGQEGDLSFGLMQNHGEGYISYDGKATEIKAKMNLKDEGSSGDGWEITMYGVQYPRHGGIILTSTSPKYSGIFALPQLALSQADFPSAKQLLVRSLMSTVQRQQDRLDGSLNPWSTSPHVSTEFFAQTPRCEYVVYLQQHPLDIDIINIQRIEDELRLPVGAPLPTVPPLKMSAILFSPDCGFVLESKGPPDFPPQTGDHLTGPKVETYLGLARRAILVYSLALCVQVFILLRQMKEASTPSIRSRISFYTIAILAMGDGFAWVVFMTIAIMVDAIALTALSAAFLAFSSVSFFGMKFLMDIWTIQAPERLETIRQSTRNPAGEPPNEPRPTTLGLPGDPLGLPLPATAQRPRDVGAAVILPPDQDIDAAGTENAAQPTPQTTLGSARREMGSIYLRFYFILFAFVIVSLHAMTWPTALRSFYINTLSFGYLSFWAPQIYRNTMRNSRRALRFEFVIGQSLIRLGPFVYLFTVSDNVLSVTVDWNVAYVLIAWVWIQVWLLVSQELLGPRFLIRSGWAPPAYDYHPILREDDEESGAKMPIGFTQATAESSSPISKPGESNESGKRVFDCAICMQNLEVPVVPLGSDRSEGSTSAAVTIFSRRNYMVTPCRHIFHSACLEGWLRYRLQCPICRENLPPL